jgi:hypothetical protein
MSRRLLLGAIVLVTIALPLHADFRAVARALDSHPGVDRISIPFLGLARLAVWVAAPEGVHDFQLATFEGTEKLDARQLQQMMERHAGQGFRPIVRTWSRSKGEWSFIYAKPAASGRTEMMILSHDSEETVLVRVEVNADVIAKHIEDEPRGVGNVSRR